MKKRTQLICLSVLIFLVVFVVLSSSIFSFSKLSVDYLTTKINTNLTAENALKCSNLTYGKSIFFVNKQQAIKNIEKQNPYIKVVNIETVFPNELIVHVAERQELFAVNVNNKYFVLDDEGKILKVANNYIGSATSPILIDSSLLISSSQNNETFEELDNLTDGEFVQNADFLKEVAKVLKEWKTSFSQLKAHLVSITNNADTLILNMRCGIEIKIFHSSANFSNKVNLAFSVYDKAEDIENKSLLEIRDVKNKDGNYEIKGFLS